MRKTGFLLIKKHLITGLADFVYVTGSKSFQLTTIDYYPAINNPVREHNIVQECLRFVGEVTRESSQRYTVTTFDPGVFERITTDMGNPAKYKKYIVMFGLFHFVCTNLKMVERKSQVVDCLLCC